MKRRAPARVIATTLLLIGAACGGDDDASSTSDSATDVTSGPSSDSATDVTSGPTSDSPTDATTIATQSEPAGQRFPDVVDAIATFDDGAWSFSVTISSPYDTPERYADGWRVLGPDGTVYGVHTLAHDHANEQPFTRRQTGVSIPDGVTEVTIEGRDQANGFGGGTVTILLQTG